MSSLPMDTRLRYEKMGTNNLRDMVLSRILPSRDIQNFFHDHFRVINRNFVLVDKD